MHSILLVLFTVNIVHWTHYLSSLRYKSRKLLRSSNFLEHFSKFSRKRTWLFILSLIFHSSFFPNLVYLYPDVFGYLSIPRSRLCNIFTTCLYYIVRPSGLLAVTSWVLRLQWQLLYDFEILSIYIYTHQKCLEIEIEKWILWTCLCQLLKLRFLTMFLYQWISCFMIWIFP